MNQSKSVILIISILVLVYSCQQKDFMQDKNIEGCDFVQIDEDNDGLLDDTERDLMNSCANDAFTSKSEIEDNLIGEWNLIGFGHGWITTPSQPCAFITISEDELSFSFKNEYKDILKLYSWEIEEITWSGGVYFNLKTSPDDAEGLFLNSFCENYMYGDATPSDGNMHLYQKVK